MMTLTAEPDAPETTDVDQVDPTIIAALRAQNILDGNGKSDAYTEEPAVADILRLGEGARAHIAAVLEQAQASGAISIDRAAPLVVQHPQMPGVKVVMVDTGRRA